MDIDAVEADLQNQLLKQLPAVLPLKIFYYNCEYYKIITYYDLINKDIKLNADKKI